MAPSPARLGSPTLDDLHDSATVPGVPPTIDAAPGLTDEAPGLFEQVGATRESVKRLVGSHVELARAEFEEIADSVKRAAIFGGVAIAAGLFAALLLGVGLPLWLGEWLFGSIGWGVL